MKKTSVFGTPNKSYLGLYQAPDECLRVIVTPSGETLILGVYGHKDIRFSIRPHAIRTLRWPKDMFELADCTSMAPDLPSRGLEFSQHTALRFIRDENGILSFAWAAYKDQVRIVFTKCTTQLSPLLLLPAEIRLRIARMVVQGEEDKVIISKTGIFFEHSTYSLIQRTPSGG